MNRRELMLLLGGSVTASRRVRTQQTSMPLTGFLNVTSPPKRRSGRSGLLPLNAAASCWYPQVKGVTIMGNGIYNGWRMEDVWLDK
jgi:hypothetical protein